MDQGTEAVTDTDEQAALRRQATAINRRSLGIAVAVTAAVMLVPTL